MGIALFSALLLLGLLAGSLSGLLGIGGGVVLVPALVYLFGLTQHAAQGTTLAIMVPPIGFLAALSYYRRGHVNLRVATLICLGFAGGAYLGAMIATSLSAVMLQRVFGIGLAAIAIKALLSRESEQPEAHQSAASKSVSGAMAAGVIVLGLVVGIVSGLIGVGGGILLVPGLVMLFGFSQQEAQGTTLALMVPPIGLPAALHYAQNGHLDLFLTAVVAAGFFLGGLLGARVAQKLPTRALTRIFGVCMLLIAIKMLWL